MISCELILKTYEDIRLHGKWAKDDKGNFLLDEFGQYYRIATKKQQKILNELMKLQEEETNLLHERLKKLSKEILGDKYENC
jgi:hypothetical protein